MERASALPSAVPPEPLASPPAPPVAEHMVSPRPPRGGAGGPPPAPPGPMRTVCGESRSSRLPTPLFPLRRSNSLGRGLTRPVENSGRAGEGAANPSAACAAGSAAAEVGSLQERAAGGRQAVTKRNTLPALSSRLLPRGGSLRRLRPSNALTAAAAAAVGTNRGSGSASNSGDGDRLGNATVSAPASIGGSWASSLGFGPRRSPSPDVRQVPAGSAKRVAPSPGVAPTSVSIGHSASAGRLRQPSPAASSANAPAVGSGAGSSRPSGAGYTERLSSSTAVSAGSECSRPSSYRSPRNVLAGYLGGAVVHGYGGAAAGASSGRPPPAPSSITPRKRAVEAKPADLGPTELGGGDKSDAAAASSSTAPAPLPRGRQMPDGDAATSATPVCRAGSLRSASSPAQSRSQEACSLDSRQMTGGPASTRVESRCPSVSSIMTEPLAAESAASAPADLSSGQDDVELGSPVITRPPPLEVAADVAEATSSSSTAAAVQALKVTRSPPAPITPLNLPLTAELEAPRSPSSSSGAGDIYGQTDQGSWGSASASKPCRTPPLSPLSMAQRHMLNRKPLGLRNLGNTCFLNAALQVLAHAPLLAPFFLQGNFIRDLNAANPLGTGGVLATAFAGLLRSLYPVEEGNTTGDGKSSNEDSFTPEEFYASVCKLFPLLGEQKGAQQDAHEVLSFLLDALHEDLNRAREKPPYVERKDLEEADLSRKGEERFAAEAWHDHLRRHRSVLVDLCQGQLRSQVRCCECGCASVTFDPFLFLSLPLSSELKHGNNQPIEEAIRDFCKEERLDGSDCWGCPRCERRVSALKRLSLWKLPLLLLVHLKRFGFEASASWETAPRAWKIEGAVTVPFSRLDLQRFVADSSPQRVPLQYDLFAAVDHVGATPLVGHYTASCRRADGWWRFDDSRAEFLGGCGQSDEAVARERVVGEGNYLLLFQRRDAPPEPELVREQSHKMPENWPHVKDPNVEWSFLPDIESSQQQ